MRRFAALLAGLWAGSLTTICAIVAPTLFTLMDRPAAGRVAAQFFHIETWLSAAMAAALMTMLSTAPAYVGRKTDLTLVAITAAGPLLSTLVLGVFMEQARLAGDMARFGMLHGASAILFAIACVSSLALLWRLTRA